MSSHSNQFSEFLHGEFKDWIKKLAKKGYVDVYTESAETYPETEMSQMRLGEDSIETPKANADGTDNPE